MEEILITIGIVFLIIIITFVYCAIQISKEEE